MPHRASPHDYPEIRAFLAPEYESASTEQIEAVLTEAFGDVDAEALEDFMGTLKKVGRGVVRRLPQIASGAAAGAGAGAAAGPWGAAIGAAVGAGVGALSGGGRSARASGRPPPATPSRAARPARTPRPAPSSGPTGPPRPAPPLAARPSGTAARPNAAAAAQLLQVLFRPEVMQALMSMAAGTSGRRTVQVGEADVPVAAVANVVSELAERAAFEYHAAGGAPLDETPGYLVGPEGESLADPASPEQRAEVVLSLWAEDDHRRAQARRRSARCERRARAFRRRMGRVPADERPGHLRLLQALDHELRATPRARRRTAWERLDPATQRAVSDYRCHRRSARRSSAPAR